MSALAVTSLSFYSNFASQIYVIIGDCILTIQNQLDHQHSNSHTCMNQIQENLHKFQQGLCSQFGKQWLLAGKLLRFITQVLVLFLTSLVEEAAIGICTEEMHVRVHALYITVNLLHNL